MAEVSQTADLTPQLAGPVGQHGLYQPEPSVDSVTDSHQNGKIMKHLARFLSDGQLDWRGTEVSQSYHSDIGIFATAIGGDGGDGGDGGHGGAGSEGGTGGNGGNGGNGGYADTAILDASIDTGPGNDWIGLFATAVGGEGGDGGDGGHGGAGSEGGTGGNGGNGGNGGYAIADILDTSIRTGAGNDWIGLFATAIGGDGGDGGHGGKAGKGPGGEAGLNGAGGHGGSADALIENVYVDAGCGQDSINIGLTAKAGHGGEGWPPGADATAYITMVDSTFLGGEGNDRFKLSTYTDSCTTLYEISGNTFDGGAGRDSLDLSGLTVKAIVNLAASTLSLIAKQSVGTNVLKSIEVITGTNFGDQFVFAGHGTKVAGGCGGDRFELSDVVKTVDIITDFSRKGGDKLIIDSNDFGCGLRKGGSVNLFNVNDKSDAYKSGKGGYFVYDSHGKNAGTLYFDPTGGSSKDAYCVAVLSNKAALSCYDFAIV